MARATAAAAAARGRSVIVCWLVCWWRELAALSPRRGAGRNLDCQWNLPVPAPVVDFVADVGFICSSQGGKVVFTATTTR